MISNEESCVREVIKEAKALDQKHNSMPNMKDPPLHYEENETKAKNQNTADTQPSRRKLSQQLLTNLVNGTTDDNAQDFIPSRIPSRRKLSQQLLANLVNGVTEERQEKETTEREFAQNESSMATR
jgi:hypothetical protein